MRLIFPPQFGIANGNEGGSPVIPVPVPVAGAFRRRKITSSWNLESPLVRATATIERDSGGGKDICDSKSPSFSLQILGALFAFWYLFNIYFNIFNRQVLQVYPFPLSLSAYQFAVGTLSLYLLCGLQINRYKRPNISSSQLLAIVPLAINVRTLGNLFTNTSLGKFPTIWVLSSLMPIVGGVALASLTAASFNWLVIGTKVKLANQRLHESLDNITLFSIITIMSFFLSVPVALFVEGINFTPSYIQSAGLNLREIYTRSLLAALCFHAYQQVAYMILARVSPVSHSIGNCVKRVVVIVSSVLLKKTSVSPIDSFGTGVAPAGVFLYSRVKKIKAKAS